MVRNPVFVKSEGEAGDDLAFASEDCAETSIEISDGPFKVGPETADNLVDETKDLGLACDRSTSRGDFAATIGG